MPYFKTSYDTTVGKIFDNSRLEFALKEALLSIPLPEASLRVKPIENLTPVFITGLNSIESNIQVFIHPYYLENHKGKDYLFSDIRAFRNKDASEYSNFEESIKNRTEYSLQKTLSALTLIWLNGNIKQIQSKYSFAGSVYAAWLSQAISRTYALDYGDQIKITALATYFYHSLFSKDDQNHDDDLELAVIHSIKTTKLPAKELYELFRKVGVMRNVGEFCEKIYDVTENVKLKGINLSVLLTIVRNTWYGLNAKEIVSVALEHPPTWISVVFTTMTERSYKSSTLYKVIESVGKSGNINEFKSNFLMLMDDALALECIGNVVSSLDELLKA